MSLNPYLKVHLLTKAEGGDATVLAALGIQIVTLCAQGMVWPHTNTVAATAVNIEIDAAHPSWMVTGEAQRLAALYGDEVIALADPGVGLCQASYLLTCTLAEWNGWSFDAAFADLESNLPARPNMAEKTDVSSDLRTQGRALWPAV